MLNVLDTRCVYILGRQRGSSPQRALSSLAVRPHTPLSFILPYLLYAVHLLRKQQGGIMSVIRY